MKEASLIESLAKAVTSPVDDDSSVTRENFRLWQSHPITTMFFKSMASKFIDHLDDDLPPDHARAGALALIRQGEKGLVEDLLDWEPVYTEDDDE